LLFSRFLALYITPTFYVSMARLEAALALLETGLQRQSPV